MEIQIVDFKDSSSDFDESAKFHRHNDEIEVYKGIRKIARVSKLYTFDCSIKYKIEIISRMSDNVRCRITPEYDYETTSFCSLM